MTGQDLKDLRRRWGDTLILNETGWRMSTLRVYSSRRGALSRRTSLQLRLARARLCAAERQKTAKPWWWPRLASDVAFARHGHRYTTIWDHPGEAYLEFEKLADALMLLHARHQLLENDLRETIEDRDSLIAAINPRSHESALDAVRRLKRRGK